MKDRIESNKLAKKKPLFLWLAIIAIVVAAIRLWTEPALLTGNGKLADFTLLLLPVGLYINYRSRLTKWGKQFIEWDQEVVRFSSRILKSGMKISLTYSLSYSSFTSELPKTSISLTLRTITKTLTKTKSSRTLITF